MCPLGGLLWLQEGCPGRVIQTGLLKGIPESCCLVSRAAAGMSYTCSHCTGKENLRSLCPQTVWPLWEPVQPHVPPINSKALTGRLWTGDPASLNWADMPRRGWPSEAVQHHYTCYISERFVLAHIMHQTHSQHTVISSRISKW